MAPPAPSAGVLRAPAPATAVQALAALVSMPTVSSDPRHTVHLRRCARWLAARLAGIGLERVRLEPGARHPLVVAEHRHARGRPTVLLYAHYDVQPPGPRRAWRTPPFTPVVRGADIFGRGASDDKGQLLCHVLALEALITAGRLPVNIVVLLDGEEETGSPGLAAALARVLRATPVDAALISDTRMLDRARPALTVGLRGSLAAELEVRGPPRDLHSGAFGGAVHNPLQTLCEVIAGLHGRDGRIAVAGAYAGARLPRAAERHLRSDAEILSEAGVPAGWGEEGFSAYERTTARPALTVNGITGGHQGPGAMATIPATASAKLSFRLVPDQRPDAVERALRRHLATHVPPTVRWRLVRQAATLPMRADSRDPAHRAAIRACRRVWGRPPALVRSGGSIAAAETLTHRFGVPTVLLGFALPDDRAHGPNEKFHLPHLSRGAATVAAFLCELGRAPP